MQVMVKFMSGNSRVGSINTVVPSESVVRYSLAFGGVKVNGG